MAEVREIKSEGGQSNNTENMYLMTGIIHFEICCMLTFNCSFNHSCKRATNAVSSATRDSVALKFSEDQESQMREVTSR